MLPFIPGSIFVALGILIYKLMVPQSPLSWTFVCVAIGLSILSQVIDMLTTVWGTRKFGGSWAGVIGAILGLIIGPILLTPFIGIFIGPFLGAVIGELVAGKCFYHATKAGWGTVIGGLVSFVLRFTIVCGLIGYTFFTLISTSPLPVIQP
ncbi:MAG TPA: DUF456 domain-containing protein [Opitutales bacterium]|nr:DUF456 domain-containing protein [Opitutales bacterium]